MAKVVVLADGIKLSRAAGGNKAPAIRGKAKGWTAAVARRNTSFLMAVDAGALSGVGVSATLTIGRDGPPVSPKMFEGWRRSLIERLRRMGLVRLHWVLEFQRSGAPHLHLMAYFQRGDARGLSDTVKSHWLQIVEPTGAAIWSQHAVPVTSPLGWKQYLAKHGSRGAAHYQRSVLPAGWEEPGRMWGKSGEWPSIAAEFETDDAALNWLRRRVRAWRLADARQALARARERGDERAAAVAVRRIVSARHMLRCGSETASHCRGATEWLPRSLSARLLAHVQQCGGLVRDWSDRGTVPQSPPGGRSRQEGL